MNKAIYPGTFDPITFGHIDIIERCSKIYKEVIVGVHDSSRHKEMFFNASERKYMIEKSISHLNNVEVKIFNSLLVDFTKKEECNIIIRGLRVLSDFEYEFKMALMNRSLNSNVTTLFMMPHQKYTHISSSLIREIASLGGGLSEYVPVAVEAALKKKYD